MLMLIQLYGGGHRLDTRERPLMAQSGHELVRRTCLLLTQSGHRYPLQFFGLSR